MNGFDPRSYSVMVKRVVYADGKAIFKSTVKEIPHVAEYGDSCTDVYDLALSTIERLHNMAKEMGDRFPDPVIEEADDGH
jgi:hypothetical protein